MPKTLVPVLVLSVLLLPPYCLAKSSESARSRLSPSVSKQDAKEPQGIDHVGVPYQRWEFLVKLRSKRLLSEVQQFGLQRMSADAANYWCAAAHISYGDYEGAAQYLDSIRDYSKLSEFGLGTVIKGYANVDNHKKVLYLSQIAVDRGDVNEDTYQCRGNAFEVARNYDEAIKTFIQAAQVLPDRKSFMIEKAGACCIYDKKYDKAITLLTEAMKCNKGKSLATVQGLRGNAYFALGKWDLAAKDFTVTIDSLNSSSRGRGKDYAGDAVLSKAYQYRAQCYQKLGRKDLAARDIADNKKIGQHFELEFFAK